MDNAELVRMYKSSIQRVKCSLVELNSEASFIAINILEKRLAVWIGSKSSQVDAALAQKIGADIVSKEFRLSTSTNPIPVHNESKLEKVGFLQSFNNLMLV